MIAVVGVNFIIILILIGIFALAGPSSLSVTSTGVGDDELLRLNNLSRRGIFGGEEGSILCIIIKGIASYCSRL